MMLCFCLIACYFRLYAIELKFRTRVYVIASVYLTFRSRIVKVNNETHEVLFYGELGRLPLTVN
jgi:hypothetical protein